MNITQISHLKHTLFQQMVGTFSEQDRKGKPTYLRKLEELSHLARHKYR